MFSLFFLCKRGFTELKSPSLKSLFSLPYYLLLFLSLRFCLAPECISIRMNRFDGHIRFPDILGRCERRRPPICLWNTFQHKPCKSFSHRQKARSKACCRHTLVPTLSFQEYAVHTISNVRRKCHNHRPSANGYFDLLRYCRRNCLKNKSFPSDLPLQIPVCRDHFPSFFFSGKIHQHETIATTIYAAIGQKPPKAAASV